MTQQETQREHRTSNPAPGGPASPDGESITGPVKEQVKEQVKDAAGQAKEMAGQAVEQAQQTVGNVVDQAKAQTTSQLSNQKERAAGSLGTVAQALRQTGQELRHQDQDTAGRYADSVAQQVERFAGYLREHDVSDLLEDVEDLARRQPGLFLGGAVALGFLGSRFLMSSGRRAERRQRALVGNDMAGRTGGAPGAITAYRPEPLSARMGPTGVGPTAGRGSTGPEDG